MQPGCEGYRKNDKIRTVLYIVRGDNAPRAIANQLKIARRCEISAKWRALCHCALAQLNGVFSPRKSCIRPSSVNRNESAKRTQIVVLCVLIRSTEKRNLLEETLLVNKLYEFAAYASAKVQGNRYTIKIIVRRCIEKDQLFL